MSECFEPVSVKLQNMKFIKILSEIFELLHADRQRDSHGEVNRLFVTNALKIAKKKIITGIQLQLSL
jgi:hypothetical protein